MKIAINSGYGGFSLSASATARILEIKGQDSFSEHIERTDPALIQAIEELGEKADGSCASLRVIEIPDGIKYEIDEYDGWETVHEVHRSWG